MEMTATQETFTFAFGGRHEILNAIGTSLIGSRRFWKVWLPVVDTFRTLCLAPPSEIKRLFESLADLAQAR